MRRSKCCASLLKMQATYHNSSLDSVYPHKQRHYPMLVCSQRLTKEPHQPSMQALTTSYTKELVNLVCGKVKRVIKKVILPCR